MPSSTSTVASSNRWPHGDKTTAFIVDQYDNEHTLPGPYLDIASIIRANRDAGEHWFSKNTLAFFSSEIEDEVFGGRLFLSSEKPPEGPRKWSVRVAADDGSIATVGEFLQYSSRANAAKAARAFVQQAATRSHLESALKGFADIVLEAAGGAWNHLTCREADSLSDVLRAAGFDEAADRLIDIHADGDDDPEDAHYKGES